MDYNKNKSKKPKVELFVPRSGSILESHEPNMLVGHKFELLFKAVSKLEIQIL